jgi:cytoskeletal protein RodZ
MSMVSEQLRQARHTQGLSVQQVVEISKIRTDHLLAIEEGNFDVFSAPVYIKGFIRTYATILKLDVPQVMAELDLELKQSTKFAEPPPFTDEPRGVLDFFMLQLSKVDWQKGAIILGLLVALVAGFSIILMVRHHHKSDPLAGIKPGIYQNTQRLSGEKLPLPGTNAVPGQKK